MRHRAKLRRIQACGIPAGEVVAAVGHIIRSVNLQGAVLADAQARRGAEADRGSSSNLHRDGHGYAVASAGYQGGAEVGCAKSGQSRHRIFAAVGSALNGAYLAVHSAGYAAGEGVAVWYSRILGEIKDLGARSAHEQTCRVFKLYVVGYSDIDEHPFGSCSAAR